MSTENHLKDAGEMSFEDIISSQSEDLHDLKTKKTDDVETKTAEEIQAEAEAAEKLETEKAEKAEKAEAEATSKKLEDEKEKPPKQSGGFTKFTSKAKEFIENGRWSDAKVEIDGEEFLISELKDIDEELFFQIDEDQEVWKSEDIKSKYIKKDDLDDTTQRLNEIALEGGDITEVIKAYDEFVHPLKGLDLNSVQIQEALVRNDLNRMKLDPTIIELTIEKYKTDAVLDTKANAIVENVNTAFNALLDQKQKEASDNKIAATEKLKTYKTSLEDIYKDATLEKKEIRKLVEFGTGKTKEGKKEVDRVVAEILNDPNKAADLIRFLYDQEAFLEAKGAKKDRTTKIDTLRKVGAISKSKTKTKAGTHTEDDDDSGLNFVERK